MRQDLTLKAFKNNVDPELKYIPLRDREIGIIQSLIYDTVGMLNQGLEEICPA